MARQTPVRVGVCHNPPKVFWDESHHPAGFFPELIQAIAQQEGWSLEFVECDWPNCLASLEQGDLDLMLDVSYSPKRDRRFDFNREVVFASWSVVYARRGTQIESILDLDGKKIAVLEDGIQYESLKTMAREFDIQPLFVPVPDYFALFHLLESGKVDGGVVNRFFPTQVEPKNVVKTNILIKPDQVHFATPEGQNDDLLSAIDRHLAIMKSSPNSIYYQASDRWLAGLDIQPVNWRRMRQLGILATSLIATGFMGLILLWNHTLRREIQARNLIQARLQHDALHDDLTGLPNRTQLLQRLEQILQKPQREAHRLALLFIDLDQFKVVNDSLGHLVGDQLLLEMAHRLRCLNAANCLIARLGGDEFVVLLEQLADIHAAVQVAEWILQTLKIPLWLNGHEVCLGGSIGIVWGSERYQRPAELIRDADIAMYRAKTNGRSRYAIFIPDMLAQASQRLSLENELRKALDQQEFVLHYQPIVNLTTQELVGLEALVRWQHPQKGLRSPAEFIPVAEETGLIVPLGWWVMETAAQQLRRWQVTFSQATNLTVSVNVSAAQLLEPNFVERVDGILTRTGLGGKSLMLEITESLLIDHASSTCQQLQRLQDRQIGISIDDFGTGYSSFSYLHKLPLTTLKIDRAFTRDLSDSDKSPKIVETMIVLARQIGLKSTAEGIETEQQRLHLQKLGCDFGQGYWFDRPQPVAVVHQRLAEAIWFCRKDPLFQGGTILPR
jgi:diguanylate cyclase (GGDEF)-like protein